ncbi:hypothetical protein MMC14_007043 [Varicellaria rhodocarpa]|nr:hypothetical protein [Varicellaria rhodocarpa]
MSSIQSTVIPPPMLSAVTATEAVSTGDPLHNSFPFLHLPTELRQMIYERLFICPENIGTTGFRVKSVMKHARTWRNFSFARSCRQIWNESEHYFFARNRFDFYKIRSFLTFLEAIGIEGRQLLTKVRYFHSVGHPFIVLRYLRSLTNVRELEIFARVRMPKYPGSWWVSPVSNVKTLLEERATPCSEDYHVKTFLSTKDYWVLEHCYDTLIDFGPISGVGEAAAQLDQAPPDNCQAVKRLLIDNLMRVKGEIMGYIIRYATTSITASKTL